MADKPAHRDQNTGGRALLVAACLIIVIAGLKAAKTLILPFLLALFLAMVTLPLLNWLREKNLPTPLAVLATVVVAGVHGEVVSANPSSSESSSSESPPPESSSSEIGGSARPGYRLRTAAISRPACFSSRSPMTAFSSSRFEMASGGSSPA